MDPIFEGIKEAGRALGLDVKRVKDLQGDYRITDQIIRMIRSARFIVADLSHERPNVYFELGYARGLGKTVITIAREGSTVHFDVKDWTYVPYVDSRVLEQDLKRRFEFELTRK
jgi:nucleoside 2-deoxyribosyltransferase